MSEGTLQPGQSIKPKATKDDAVRLIDRFFGVQVTCIKELNSYDDLNYYVEGINSNGNSTEKFVFKILNSMDSRKNGHIQAEARAMNILHANGVHCPVPMKTKDDRFYATVEIGSNEHDLGDDYKGKAEVNIIRLLRYVEGKLLTQVTLTPRLLFDAGQYIARIETLLEDMETKGLEGHNSIWILSSVPDLRKFTYVLDKEEKKRNLVEEIICAFEGKVVPLYPVLPQGVLHGDFNEQNILCREDNEKGAQIHGVIDFGDVHVGYYVFELAITVMYMMLECGKPENGIEPLVGAGHVIAGYCSIKSLNAEEMSVLKLCTAARFCQSLVMGAYTYSQDPGNTYLLITQERGWKMLEDFWRGTSDKEALDEWEKILQSYSNK